MSPKIVDKAEKRKQIGLLALSYFAEEGAATGSISQIAQAVGVGKGTIYEYFRSKEELITYAMELYIEEAEEKVGRFLNGISDPKDRLRRYSIQIVEHIVEDPKTTGILLALFQLILADAGKQGQNNLFTGMFEQARMTIAEIINRGVEQGDFKSKAGEDSHVIAINLIAFLDGLWMHYLASGDFDLNQQVNHYLDNLYATIEVEGD